MDKLEYFESFFYQYYSVLCNRNQMRTAIEKKKKQLWKNLCL